MNGSSDSPEQAVCEPRRTASRPFARLIWLSSASGHPASPTVTLTFATWSEPPLTSARRWHGSPATSVSSFAARSCPDLSSSVVVPALEGSSGKRAGQDFGVCMNPEFLREGTAIDDFYHPPKTVIGELDTRSGEALMELYKNLPGEIRRVPLRVAEMVKYADNAFHALKVVFANEIGSICKSTEIDSHRVMEIFCLDTKLNLSPYYLKPGFSFGGSCLPKDLRALNYLGRSRDVETPTLSSILSSNRQHLQSAVGQLVKHKGKRLGFLGLSFKSGTDDLRESPLVELIETVIGKGFDVRVFDPYVSLGRLIGANKEFIEKEIPHISKLMCRSAEELLEVTDLIVVGHNGQEVQVCSSANFVSPCRVRPRASLQSWLQCSQPISWYLLVARFDALQSPFSRFDDQRLKTL